MMELTQKAIDYLLILFDYENEAGAYDAGFESKAHHYELERAGLIDHYSSNPWYGPGEARLTDAGRDIARQIAEKTRNRCSLCGELKNGHDVCLLCLKEIGYP